MTYQYQSVLGAVDTGTTPKVQYVYNEMAGGENNSRLRSVIYPNGRILDYTYSSAQEPVTGLSSSGTTATVTTAAAHNLSVGDTIVIEGAGSPYDGTFTVASVVNSTQFTYTLASSYTGSSSGTDITEAKLSLDSTISRADGEQDHAGSAAGTSLELDSFLGLSTIVQRTRGNGVNLSYITQASDPHAPAPIAPGGDRYTGLDAFGRIVDQLWGSASSPADRFQYNHDRDGNTLYKNNLLSASNSELYHASSTATGDNNEAYDNLNRLQAFERGTLSASGHNGTAAQGGLDTVASPGETQSWTLDAVGNATSFAGQSRAFNSQNQITSITGTISTPSYDNNGNTILDDNGNTLTYDAWNRLVKVTQSGNTVETRSYYPGGQVAEDVDVCNSVTTHSYYSADWQVLEDDTRTGSGFPRPPFLVADQYVWGLGYVDDLVARDDNSSSGSLGKSSSGLGRRLYALQDANYNVTAIVDTSGTVQERFLYDPYGSVQPLTAGWASTLDSFSWHYLFQGGRQNRVLSFLYDFRHRTYSATLGTWLQKDPLGYIDGPDRYQAFRSGPTTHHDAIGLTSESDGDWWDDPAMQDMFRQIENDSPLHGQPPPDAEQAPEEYLRNLQESRELAAREAEAAAEAETEAVIAEEEGLGLMGQLGVGAGAGAMVGLPVAGGMLYATQYYKNKAAAGDFKNQLGNMKSISDYWHNQMSDWGQNFLDHSTLKLCGGDPNKINQAQQDLKRRLGNLAGVLAMDIYAHGGRPPSNSGQMMALILSKYGTQAFKNYGDDLKSAGAVPCKCVKVKQS